MYKNYWIHYIYLLLDGSSVLIPELLRLHKVCHLLQDCATEALSSHSPMKTRMQWKSPQPNVSKFSDSPKLKMSVVIWVIYVYLVYDGFTKLKCQLDCVNLTYLGAYSPSLPVRSARVMRLGLSGCPSVRLFVSVCLSGCVTQKTIAHGWLDFFTQEVPVARSSYKMITQEFIWGFFWR